LTVVDKGGGVGDDGVGEDGSVVGNKGSVVGNGVGDQGSVVDDGSVGNNRSVVDNGVSDDRGSMSISSLGFLRVDRGALIGDLSDETVLMVSGVGGGLDSAVGKGDGERSSYVSISVLGFSLLEVGLGVVISNAVFIGERLRGEFLNWGIGGGGSISWGSSRDGSSHSDESRGEDDLVHVDGVGDTDDQVQGLGSHRRAS